MGTAWARHEHGMGTVWARHWHDIGTAWARHEHGMGTAWVRHGHEIGTAWARHGMCESALRRHWNKRKYIAGKLRLTQSRNNFSANYQQFWALALRNIRQPLVLLRESLEIIGFGGAPTLLYFQPGPFLRSP